MYPLPALSRARVATAGALCRLAILPTWHPTPCAIYLIACSPPSCFVILVPLLASHAFLPFISLEEFTRLLREETDVRLSVVGPWAADIVAAENNFRLNVRNEGSTGAVDAVDDELAVFPGFLCLLRSSQ